MRLGKLLLFLLLFLFIGGFLFFAFMPVNIEQNEMIQDIPSEAFLDESK